MSILPHTILRPFGVNPGGRYLRRHALRASIGEAKNGKELGISKKKAAAEESRLEVLYDDGFGTVTMKDYFQAVRVMIEDDGGPPRWFCPVECGRPEVDKAPLLLFLPGLSTTYGTTPCVLLLVLVSKQNQSSQEERNDNSAL